MIWNKIQELLDKKEWSVYRLKEETGLADTTIRNIKTGASTNPGIKTMAKIADALEVSLDEFREEDE